MIIRINDIMTNVDDWKKKRQRITFVFKADLALQYCT